MSGQIAVACVLLIGAGLLGRTFQSLLDVDRGYNPNSLLTARLSMRPGSTFAKDGAKLRAITDRLKALPGVEHTSFGNAPIPGTKRVARVEENTAADHIELSAGKIPSNVRRAKQIDRDLGRLGFDVVRIWETSYGR